MIPMLLGVLSDSGGIILTSGLCHPGIVIWLVEFIIQWTI